MRKKERKKKKERKRKKERRKERERKKERTTTTKHAAADNPGTHVRIYLSFLSNVSYWRGGDRNNESGSDFYLTGEIERENEEGKRKEKERARKREYKKRGKRRKEKERGKENERK